jgi:hypothetical protein
LAEICKNKDRVSDAEDMVVIETVTDGKKKKIRKK